MREQEAADIILIDHEISPSQAFNLEKEVGGEVMDRTMVILEIFHRHASSRFARAQVEIARLGYMGPRLREAAKQAGPKDRARSGTGTNSPFEVLSSLMGRRLPSGSMRASDMTVLLPTCSLGAGQYYEFAL